MHLLLIPQGTLMLVFIDISWYLNCTVVFSITDFGFTNRDAECSLWGHWIENWNSPGLRAAWCKHPQSNKCPLWYMGKSSQLRHSVVWKGTAEKQERSSMSHCPSINIWILLPFEERIKLGSEHSRTWNTAAILLGAPMRSGMKAWGYLRSPLNMTSYLPKVCFISALCHGAATTKKKHGELAWPQRYGDQTCCWIDDSEK